MIRNWPIREGKPLQPDPSVSVIIRLHRKVFFQQRIVQCFGAQRLAEILQSFEPFIFLIVDYSVGWEVYIFVLL